MDATVCASNGTRTTIATPLVMAKGALKVYRPWSSPPLTSCGTTTMAKKASP